MAPDEAQGSLDYLTRGEFDFWERALLAAIRAGESPPEWHADRALEVWQKRRRLIKDHGHAYRGPRR